MKNLTQFHAELYDWARCMANAETNPKITIYPEAEVKHITEDILPLCGGSYTFEDVKYLLKERNWYIPTMDEVFN